MLKFIYTPAYDEACKSIAKDIATFMKNAQRKQGLPPAFLESGTCIPFPDTVANDVYHCIKQMDLRRLNLQLLRMVMNGKMERTDWECAFAKLIRVLAEMESIGSGQSED